MVEEESTVLTSDWWRAQCSPLIGLQACLNTVGENAVLGSMAVAAMASTNILLDFFLLIGACCGVRSDSAILTT